MEQYINQIINADCLEVLKNIPDESIDLVCTDCPYRIIGGGCATGTYGNLRQEASPGVLFRGCGKCAKNLKRRFIGIEIDEQYATVANERLEQAQRQQMLF